MQLVFADITVPNNHNEPVTVPMQWMFYMCSREYGSPNTSIIYILKDSLYLHSKPGCHC